MLTDYIRAAMAHARYEILPDSGAYYGSIPDFQGVWADAPTLEACHGNIGRDLLARILREAGISREDWETVQ